MENQNEMVNPQGGDLSTLKKMFSDYQKKQSPPRRKTSEEILAKYFTPRKTKETFRILPPKVGKKHIEEAFFHVIITNITGGKKKHGTKIYCPAHNDPKVNKLGPDGKPALDSNGVPVMIPAPCPLCLKAKKLLTTQNPALKGRKKETLNEDELKIWEKNRAIFMEANNWEAKKFYIIRGIDRGVTADGVKIWRFKHNFKNQGTLDKLLPILEEFMTLNQADFADAKNGTDLSITMADTDVNGHIYKTISAISSRGKSPLHTDPIVAQQWLDDDITWRDVFLPKKAPNITAYEFLEMCLKGENPYWDYTDAENKHWVFPNNPELEKLANTRTQNLDADDDEAFEQASDLMDEELPRVTISNITPDKVGTYTDNAVNVGETVLNTASKEKANIPVKEKLVESEPIPTGEYYDDLPF